MKKIIFYTCLIFVISSCSEQETLDNCDLKSYFYNPDNLHEANIHVFEKDSMGKQSTYYMKFEKIASNKIQITQYNDKFVLLSQLIDEFKDDEVDLIHTEFNSGNGEIIKGIIETGRIYSFQRHVPECEFSVLYSGSYPQKYSLRDKSKLKRSELTRKVIQGESVSTIVSRGFIERHEMYSNYQAKIPLTIWYSQGIGITLMKEDYSNGSIQYKYEKTIGDNEFSSLIQEYH